MRNTQRKGNIAVSQAMARFTKMDYDVAIPLTKSAFYDSIVDTNKELKIARVWYSGVKEVNWIIHSNSNGYVVKKQSLIHMIGSLFLKNAGEEYIIKECLLNRNSIMSNLEHLIELENLRRSRIMVITRDC